MDSSYGAYVNGCVQKARAGPARRVLLHLDVLAGINPLCLAGVGALGRGHRLGRGPLAGRRRVPLGRVLAVVGGGFLLLVEHDPLPWLLTGRVPARRREMPWAQ